MNPKESLVEFLKRKSTEKNAVLDEECTAQDISGGNYDNAWDDGFDAGERSMAGAVLKILAPKK